MARSITTSATDSNIRDWLKRMVLSLVGAVGVGAFAYLITRAVTSVLLFIRQQQLLSEISTAFQGGIMALANTNLHAIRLEVQRIDAQNQILSLRVGFAATVIAVVVLYLWLEKQAISKEQNVK